MYEVKFVKYWMKFISNLESITLTFQNKLTTKFFVYYNKLYFLTPSIPHKSSLLRWGIPSQVLKGKMMIVYYIYVSSQ